VSGNSPKDKEESKKNSSQSDISAAITTTKSEVKVLKGKVRRQSSNQSLHPTREH